MAARAIGPRPEDSQDSRDQGGLSAGEGDAHGDRDRDRDRDDSRDRRRSRYLILKI